MVAVFVRPLGVDASPNRSRRRRPLRPLHRAHATNPFHSHTLPCRPASIIPHRHPCRRSPTTTSPPRAIGIRFPATPTCSSSSPSWRACAREKQLVGAGIGGGGLDEGAVQRVRGGGGERPLLRRRRRPVRALRPRGPRRQPPRRQAPSPAPTRPRRRSRRRRRHVAAQVRHMPAAVQECDAYFFCLEDRALLCRSCDVAVHTANDLVSAHHRFLLTGVQVGQEQGDRSPEQPAEPSPPPPAKSNPAPLYSDSDFSWGAAAADASRSLPDWSAVNEQLTSPAPWHAEAASRATPKRSPRAPAFGAGQGRVAGGVMDWPLGEFFRGVSDFNGGFGFGESGTSKVDSRKLGASAAGSPYYYRSSEEDRNDADELFGQVPELQWSVPELPSPPTASGLHWQHGAPDSTAFVPGIVSPDSSLRCFPATAAVKRRRRC